LQINNTKELAPTNVNIMIYAHSGSGKTSAAKTLKGKTLVISLESGLLPLKDAGIDYISLEKGGMAKLRDAMSFISSSDYVNIYFDSLSEIADLFVDEAKLLYPDKRQTLPMWGHYSESFGKFLKLTRDMGKNVFYTCLVKEVKSDSGVEYYVPAIPGKLAERSLALFDFVFTIKSLENENGTGSSKGHKRMFQTFNDGKYLCKTRSDKIAEFEEINLNDIITKAFN